MQRPVGDEDSNTNNLSQASDTAQPAPDSLDISVVICTRNRAESLRQLLDSLVQDDREDVSFEVVIVDNGDSEKTRAVVRSFDETLKIRYFVETQPGKCHAMNRALDEGGFGEIVAILDDDLTLHSGWLRGVKQGCARWPDCDIFSGRSYVIFPEGETIPDWAHRKGLEGYAFSVNDPGTEDSEMRRGFYPSGNHFWIRSRVLNPNRRFQSLGILSDAGFVLGLYEDGYRGAWIGDVVAGHRVQSHLLDPKTVMLRMIQYGKDFSYVRHSNPDLFWHARVFRDHPNLWMLLCLLNSGRWYVKYLLGYRFADTGERLEAQIKAAIRLYDNWETVCHAGRIRNYIAEGQIKHTTKQAEQMGRFYDPT